MEININNNCYLKILKNDENHMAEKCFNTYKNMNSDCFEFHTVNSRTHYNVGAVINKANQGHTHAMFEIGFMFENGIFFPQNLSGAFHWYEKGAKSGDADCQLALFYMYRFGKGTEINLQKAVLWLEQSAENESIDAMFLLGQIYIEGLVAEADSEKALYWLKRSAKAGSSEAMLFLGILAEKGVLIEADRTLAYKWYLKAAALHNSEAQVRLAQLVFRDFKDNKAYMKNAVYYLNISAKNGNGEAMFVLGLYYKSLGGIFNKRAFELLKNSADKFDHMLAAFALAEMYETGTGVEANNEKAVEYYEKVLDLI